MLKSLKKFILLALIFGPIGHYAEPIHQEIIFQNSKNSIVRLGPTSERMWGTGSRMHVEGAKQSYIVTNRHVCDDFDEMIASTEFGVYKELKVLVTFTDVDICILEDIPFIPSLEVPEYILPFKKIYAIGHPAMAPVILTDGYYQSDLAYILDSPAYFSNVESYPGSSGSPILDIRGKVIGLLYAGSNAYPRTTVFVPHPYIKAALQHAMVTFK